LSFEKSLNKLRDIREQKTQKALVLLTFRSVAPVFVGTRKGADNQKLGCFLGTPAALR
jgi:hypothetical protein